MSVPNGIACKSTVPRFLNLCQTTLNSFMVAQLRDLFYGSVHRGRVVLSLNSAEAFLLPLRPVGCSREELGSFRFGCRSSLGFLPVPRYEVAKYKSLQYTKGSFLHTKPVRSQLFLGCWSVLEVKLPGKLCLEADL